MNHYPRYALYYAPAESSDLARFGARTIGYDAYSGSDVEVAPEILSSFPDWAELTRDPRKYGFHATFKAPFFLKSGATEEDLLAALSEFVAKPRTRPVIDPVIRQVESFIAIVPSVPSDELCALAEACVVEFDELRAPLTPEDRARRKPDALSVRQRGHLDQWGYPYVMQDFRFHMTLTGSLNPDQADVILPRLQQSFSALEIGSTIIDRIALFKQDDAASRFVIVTSHLL